MSVVSEEFEGETSPGDVSGKLSVLVLVLTWKAETSTGSHFLKQVEMPIASSTPQRMDPKNWKRPRPTAAPGPDPNKLSDVYYRETRKLTAVRANMASMVTAKTIIVGINLSTPYP